MNYLERLSHRPPVVVGPETSVLDAVEIMSKNRVGAVGVVDNGMLVGIFTERDLMERVVLKVRPASSTKVSEVMTSPVTSVQPNDDPNDALETMLDRHIRHLPVTDESNQIIGVLSIRNLLQDQLERARHEADSLEAFISADGAGG